jgi:hypothetical protein
MIRDTPQVDPTNEAIQKLQKLVDNEKIMTGRTTIREEKGWNVFMRLSTNAVRYVCFLRLSFPLNLFVKRVPNLCSAFFAI